MRVVLALSTTNLFSFWFFIELNLVSFVVFMLLRSDSIVKQSVQYFLIQAFSSLALIICVTRNFITLDLSLPFLITWVPLFIKLGLPPFHIWYVRFIAESEWSSLFLASRIQKVIPLFALHQTQFRRSILIFIVAIVGARGIVGQVWLKQFLAYSSIFSRAWILRLVFRFFTRFIFLFIYCFPLLALVWESKINHVSLISQFYGRGVTKGSKAVVVARILRIAGVPPIIGFTMKFWALILIIPYYMPVSLILIFSSFIILPAYLKICRSTLLTQNSLSRGFTSLNLQSTHAIFVIILFLPIFRFYTFKCLHANFWCLKI